MNTRKMLAAALRERGKFLVPGANSAVVAAMDPASETEHLLKIALSPIGTQECLSAMADYFDDNSAPVALEEADAPAPVQTDIVREQLAALSEYAILGDDDEIQVGDEWKLKDGLRHSDRSKPVMWRPVEGSVGDFVSDHEKSQFRRRKA